MHVTVFFITSCNSFSWLFVINCILCLQKSKKKCRNKVIILQMLRIGAKRKPKGKSRVGSIYFSTLLFLSLRFSCRNFLSSFRQNANILMQPSAYSKWSFFMHSKPFRAKPLAPIGIAFLKMNLKVQTTLNQIFVFFFSTYQL